MAHAMPRRPTRPESSKWSCMPCTGAASGYDDLDGTHKRALGRSCSSRHARGPTESQAMGYAMALAAEYVRVAERFPAGSASSVLERDAQPLLLYDSLGLSVYGSGGALPAPIKSTRSHKDRPRTASGGSHGTTLCDSLEPDAEKARPRGLRSALRYHGRRLRSIFA
ncbi:hypothetical protein H4R18_000934 [Coemansia javaensis]|uniref:Uncharacterized protein n=1 Tax=Coemansia javaensis TaxID=2761396 RepID=A0A9W8HIE5_9FUNG|nr:hypothetical protein H4R18_000934 [Coemansia javaensis]